VNILCERILGCYTMANVNSDVMIIAPGIFKNDGTSSASSLSKLFQFGEEQRCVVVW